MICSSTDSPRPPTSFGQLRPAQPPCACVRCHASTYSREAGPSSGGSSEGTFACSHSRAWRRKLEIEPVMSSFLCVSLVCCERGSQLMFQNLAGVVARQRLPDDHLLGDFERGDALGLQ